MNREQWLTEVAVLAQRLFTGYHLAPYRVTCGWPCRNPLGRRVRTLGECHAHVEHYKRDLARVFLVDREGYMLAVKTHNVDVVDAVSYSYGVTF